MSSDDRIFIASRFEPKSQNSDYAATYLIGLIPSLFCLVVFSMHCKARERWSLFLTVVFDLLMAIPWPSSLLGV